MTDEMPPQPTTKRLDQTEILKELLRSLQDDVKDGFKNLLTEMSVISDRVNLLTERVSLVERWKAEVEARPHFTSERARALAEGTKSRTDMELEKSIAALAGKVEEQQVTVNDVLTETKAQTASLASLERMASKLMANRLLREVAKGIGYLVLGYLASKGLHQ